MSQTAEAANNPLDEIRFLENTEIFVISGLSVMQHAHAMAALISTQVKYEMLTLSNVKSVRLYSSTRSQRRTVDIVHTLPL